MTNPSSEYYNLSNKRWRAIRYDWDTLSTYGQQTKLYCLTDFQASWLQSNVEYISWASRWDNCPCTDEDLAQFASELEFALMDCIDIQPYQITATYNASKNAQIQVYDDDYDGVNPSSINPETPDDFYSGDGSQDRVDALCTACKIYCYSYAQDWVAQAQSILGVVFLVGLAASISIVGGVIATVIVGGLFLV